jgi:hypothetical protein
MAHRRRCHTGLHCIDRIQRFQTVMPSPDIASIQTEIWP